MARPKKFKKQEVVEALKKAHGLKTGAAELLAADFKTIDKACTDYPECQAVVDHWKKRRKDRAEYKLDEAIERGESWAIMFTLKPARDREYNPALEVTGASGGPIVIRAYDYGAAVAPILSPAAQATGESDPADKKTE
jgi:hypothetical protein